MNLELIKDILSHANTFQQINYDLKGNYPDGETMAYLRKIHCDTENGFVKPAKYLFSEYPDKGTIIKKLENTEYSLKNYKKVRSDYIYDESKPMAWNKEQAMKDNALAKKAREIENIVEEMVDRSLQNYIMQDNFGRPYYDRVYMQAYSECTRNIYEEPKYLPIAIKYVSYLSWLKELDTLKEAEENN